MLPREQIIYLNTFIGKIPPDCALGHWLREVHKTVNDSIIRGHDVPAIYPPRVRMQLEEADAILAKARLEAERIVNAAKDARIEILHTAITKLQEQLR